MDRNLLEHRPDLDRSGGTQQRQPAMRSCGGARFATGVPTPLYRLGSRIDVLEEERIIREFSPAFDPTPRCARRPDVRAQGGPGVSQPRRCVFTVFGVAARNDAEQSHRA